MAVFACGRLPGWPARGLRWLSTSVLATRSSRVSRKSTLPALLDFPEPRVRAYACETVVAEKFQAMVMLGLANSRMKDYYDIWMLSRSYGFDAERLSCAIAATFARRGTAIPEEVPDALTAAFSTDATKQRQWAAFVRDLAADLPALETIVIDLADFLMPYAQQARHRSGGG